jgi:hypothetical protein
MKDKGGSMKSTSTMKAETFILHPSAFKIRTTCVSGWLRV